jgi:hypothetical protein
MACAEASDATIAAIKALHDEMMEPFRTRSAPTCVSEALYPSAVTIVTVRPCVGTWPANDTSPEAGARTVDAPPRAMSTPRC